MVSKSRRSAAPARQRIELRVGHDVIGEQAVLLESARPARGVEAEQTHETPWRGGERARRQPCYREAGFGIVFLLERFQGEIEGGGGSVSQRSSPDRSHAPRQQRFSDLLGGIEASAQRGDDFAKSAPVIPSVRPVGRAQALEQTSPRLCGGERRLGGQHPRPALRQCLEGAGVGAQQRAQSPNPALGKPAHQDVGERGGRLSFPVSGDFRSVHEMKVQVGVRPQRQEVVVVVAG